MKDIVGQRFGRLVVVSLNGTANGKRRWNCLCDCGNTAVVRQDQLIGSKTRSCGCLSAEARRIHMQGINAARPPKKPKRDHDLRHDRYNPVKHEYPRLYSIWRSMKSRCYYEKHKNFHCYGGRGITVCDEWRKYEAFSAWAKANGYRDDLTIDRIDASKGYSPDNCRWATYTEQNNHLSRNRYITIDGETKTLAEWARYYNMPYQTVCSRIYALRWNIVKALTTPVNRRKVSA